VALQGSEAIFEGWQGTDAVAETAEHHQDSSHHLPTCVRSSSSSASSLRSLMLTVSWACGCGSQAGGHAPHQDCWACNSGPGMSMLCC